MAEQYTEKEKEQARRELSRSYRKRMRRKQSKGRTVRTVLVFTFLFLFGYCTYSVVTNRIEISNRQEELTRLEAQAAALEAENASYESILTEKDERTYMERIATENLGYAYPGERRFYDTTRS